MAVLIWQQIATNLVGANFALILSTQRLARVIVGSHAACADLDQYVNAFKCINKDHHYLCCYQY
jgi:hypothetical protein